MAVADYHVTTIAELREHASESNVRIYVDNDLDAGSSEWETLRIGDATGIYFQGHKLLRPLVKANNYLFEKGSVRDAKILNVFENGGFYLTRDTNFYNCAMSCRVSTITSDVFYGGTIHNCNFNIDFPNLYNAKVFGITRWNDQLKDSLFTINGNVNRFIFDRYIAGSDSNVYCAVGCRFDGKLTGSMVGFAASKYNFAMNDCIINVDTTDCNVTGSNASNHGKVWYNSDIFNKGTFPSRWKAVTTEQLMNPEYMKSVGLDVEILG